MYKQENNSDNQPPFFDSLCTCKECSHDLSKDCVKANCICCKDGSHSMVLDVSMSYFAIPAYPQTNARKVRKTSGDIFRLRSDWYGNHSSHLSSWCDSSGEAYNSISIHNDYDAREPNGR